MQLFRPESVAGSMGNGFGEVQESLPIRLRVYGIGLCAIAVAAMVFCLLTSVNQKVILGAIVNPEHGSAILKSNFGGVVVKRFVHEGDLVSTGDPILELGDNRTAADGNSDDRISKSLAAQRDSLDAESDAQGSKTQLLIEQADNRIATLALQLQNEAEAAKVAQRRVEIASESYQRFSNLRQQGFISDAQLQQHESELLDLKEKLHELDRNRASLEAEKAEQEMSRGLNKSEMKIQHDRLERTAAQLRESETEAGLKKSRIVFSPAAGKIVQLDVREGQMLAYGERLGLISVGKDSSMQVTAFSPSSLVGEIREGQRVFLKYDAFPAPVFGSYSGKVVKVASFPKSSQMLSDELGQQVLPNSATGAFAVTIKLDSQSVRSQGKSYGLINGMSATAEVIQEKRKIWDWIFRSAKRQVGNLDSTVN